MKFIVDENMDEQLISLLRDAGYDVLSVFETARGSDDVEVLSMAVTEDRILLTYDKNDFGALLYDRGLPAPPAIILFRIPDVPGRAASAVCCRSCGRKVRLVRTFLGGRRAKNSVTPTTQLIKRHWGP